ncbi:MAG: hypothetical protein NC430_07310 [bacterium]|nr:hypothetical protein [bacterium]MCM1423612.1 hypothetical protein [bacterium]
MNNVIGLSLTALAGICFGSFIGGRFIGRQYEKHCAVIEKQGDSFSEFYTLMQQWVKVYQSGHTLVHYCEKNNYKKIAVYGMSEMGYMVLREFQGTAVEVAYCIDRNADNVFAEIDVRRPDAELPQVDAVIVAVVQFYEEVKESLEKKLSCPIISLSDVVWEA